MHIIKTPPLEETRFDIILQIWKLVNEKYPLFAEREINWEDIKLKYLHGIKSISSYDSLYKYIDRMLIELKDPHTRIVGSPWFQKSIYPLVLVSIDDALYIASKLNANYKLTTGMKILEVNGRPIEVIQDIIYAQFPFTSLSMRKATLINELMCGEFGDAIEITATDGQTVNTEVLAKQDISSIVQKHATEGIPSAIKIPPCLAKTFEDIGYIKIFAFKHKNIVQEFLKTLNECGDITSLIVDVRGNSGGLITEAVNLTSMFMTEEKTLGYRMNKDGDCEIIRVKPLPGLQKTFKNVIVLCDEFTMSSCEFIFVNALKGSEKIQVVGNQTAGLVHEATIFPLFDGTKLQVTTFKYLSHDGTVMNEVGIQPDIEVHNTVSLLTKRQDDQLNYAVKLCRD
jgi:carboxyl-terminal processing protease